MAKPQYAEASLPRKVLSSSAARYQANKEAIKKKNNEHYHRNKVLKGRKPLGSGALGIPRDDPEYMAKWLAANKEAVKARRKEFYENNKVEILRKQKEYASSPVIAQRIRDRASSWQKDNPERVRAKNNAWVAAHPEARAVEKARRTALIRDADGGHTRAEAKAILVAQRHICANPYCAADLTKTKKHLDHIVALARGGSNFASNLQWLCAECNTRKRDSDWDAWLELQHIVFGQTLVG